MENFQDISSGDSQIFEVPSFKDSSFKQLITASDGANEPTSILFETSNGDCIGFCLKKH